MILVFTFVVVVGLGLSAESEQSRLNPSISGSSDGPVNDISADNRKLIEQYHGLVDYLEESYVQIVSELGPTGVNTNKIEDLFQKSCRVWKSMGTVAQRRTMFRAFCEYCDQFIDERRDPSLGSQLFSSQMNDCSTRWKAVVQYVNHVLDAVKSNTGLTKTLDDESGPVTADGNLFYKTVILLKAVRKAAADIAVLLKAENNGITIDMPQTYTPEGLYAHFGLQLMSLLDMIAMAPSSSVSKTARIDARKRCDKLSDFIHACFQEFRTDEERQNREPFDIEKVIIQLDDSPQANVVKCTIVGTSSAPPPWSA